MSEATEEVELFLLSRSHHMKHILISVFNIKAMSLAVGKTARFYAVRHCKYIVVMHASSADSPVYPKRDQEGVVKAALGICTVLPYMAELHVAILWVVHKTALRVPRRYQLQRLGHHWSWYCSTTRQ